MPINKLIILKVIGCWNIKLWTGTKEICCLVELKFDTAIMTAVNLLFHDAAGSSNSKVLELKGGNISICH